MTPGNALPDGWRTMRFDRFAENIAERVDPAEADEDYYVGLEHLDPESLKIRRWGTPDDVKGTKLRFCKGDIIFGRRRFYQRKVAVAEFDGICSAHAMVLRAREDMMLQDFFPFFLQSETFYQRAMQISVGSLSPTINWRTLARQEFAVPPVDEQCRIADILWAADSAILAWEASLQELRIVKWVSVSNLYKSFSANRLVELGTYAEFVTSGSRGWAKYYANDGSIFVRVTNLTRESADIDLSDVKFVHPPEGAEGERTKTMVGDILISITADLGRVAVVPPGFPQAFVNQHVALVRLRLEDIDPYFAAYYLLSPRGQLQFRALNDGGTKQGMKLQSVQRLRIPQATIAEQRHAVTLIQEIDSRISKTQGHLAKQLHLKKNLLLHLLDSQGLDYP